MPNLVQGVPTIILACTDGTAPKSNPIVVAAVTNKNAKRCRPRRSQAEQVRESNDSLLTHTLARLLIDVAHIPS